MLSNKFGVIAGAAMLGTAALLGTNAANALIDLNAPNKDAAAHTYAQETITATVVGDDGMIYYKLSGGDTSTTLRPLNVQGEVGVGGTTGSILIIEFVFHGMVFTEDSDPTLMIGADNCGSGSGVGGNPATERGGGDEGENTVSFIYTRMTDDVVAETVACLELDEMGVSMGGGGVTMNVSDNIPLPATSDESFMNAIRIGSALKETPVKNTPTATVASGFLSFEGDLTSDSADDDTMQMATVGSFTVSVDTTLINAQAGDPVEEANLYTAGGTSVLAVETDVPETDSSVHFTGDFSFATRVTLNESAVCDGTDDLRMPEEDDERDTTRLRPQTLGYVNANSHLCIHVADPGSDMATPILETAPYKVSVKYVGGIDDAKHATAGMERELGYIDRDGTTVRFPYLTTRENYVQRIRIVNRGGSAKYTMDFADNATGMTDGDEKLETGRTTLKVSKLVKVDDGGTTTSGTLIIEAEPHMIDIATTLNNEDGSIDTVLYMEE